MNKQERKERFLLAESLRVEQEKLEERVLNNLWADLDRLTEGVLHDENNSWREGWIIFEDHQSLGRSGDDGFFRRLYCPGGAFNFLVVVEGREDVQYELADIGDFQLDDLLWTWESLLNENIKITTDGPQDQVLARAIEEFKEDQKNDKRPDEN
jgi:hypothetical protein